MSSCQPTKCVLYAEIYLRVACCLLIVPWSLDEHVLRVCDLRLRPARSLPSCHGDTTASARREQQQALAQLDGRLSNLMDRTQHASHIQ